MDLRRRVGGLVAAHRRRLSITQQQLADRVSMSPDMISRIETGGTGLRFSTIEKLAAALEVDPAALFMVDPSSIRDMRRQYIDLTALLSGLSDSDLDWVGELLNSALKPRR